MDVPSDVPRMHRLWLSESSCPRFFIDPLAYDIWSGIIDVFIGTELYKNCILIGCGFVEVILSDDQMKSDAVQEVFIAFCSSNKHS